MSRTRLILLGLLAVLAVGVVASTSGAEPPTGSCLKAEKVPAYCVGLAPLENASEKAEGTNGASVLKAEIASVASEVKCEKGKTTGTIEGGAAGAVGKSKTTITFEECKLLKPANCKLTSAAEKEIKTTTLKGELVLTGGRIEDKLEPREGAFAGISVEGINSSCVIAGVGTPKSFNVTGSQLCAVDSSNTAAETETEKHKLTCKISGSSLEIGAGNPAELEDETTVKLTSSKNWSVKET